LKEAIYSMLNNITLNIKTEIENFAPHESIRYALLLTYNFHGECLEDKEKGLLESLWRRDCESVLILRDGNAKAVLSEKRSLRYTVVNAAFSKRIFHSKLIFLLSDSEALAIIGSANLSPGGLEKNLELACAYHLSAMRGPQKFFLSIRDYFRDYLRKEFRGSSLANYNDFLEDFDHFLAGISVRGKSECPVFLHNYLQPLLPQIKNLLPGHKIDHLWVISPFFDPDPVSKMDSDDPPDQVLNVTVLENVLNNLHLQETDKPMHIYFQASPTNETCLPIQQLGKYQSRLSLYRKDSTAEDQRNLHGKMLVFIGRTRTGKSFMTLVHGSANFTEAALLSTPPGGNAEIVVVTHLPQPETVSRHFERLLNLHELFSEVEDWNSLKTRTAARSWLQPSLHVWDAMASISDNKVTVYFQINDRNAITARVYLTGHNVMPLLAGDLNAPFAETASFELPASAWLRKDDLRQLPYCSVRIDVHDESGKLLASVTAPLNVDCPDAFVEDFLITPENQSVEQVIYLDGLGTGGGYIRLRQSLERRLTQARAQEQFLAPVPTHHADLDLFFRRLHIGFRGLHYRVEQSNGSPYVVGDALRRLAEWAKLTVDEQQRLMPEQRLYLADLVIRAAMESIATLKKSKTDSRKVAEILQRKFVSQALPLRTYGQTLRNDQNLGVVARSILARWGVLSRTGKGAGQR
jgi:hypothetical protein